MDLVSLDKLKSFSFNWTGYETFCKLLIELKCDVREIKMINDGDRIKSNTCKSWAKAISNGLEDGNIKKILVPDTSYMGGHYEKLVCGGNYSAKRVDQKEGRGNEQDKGDDSKESDNKNELLELTEEDITWLKEICYFLETCGGCRQW